MNFNKKIFQSKQIAVCGQRGSGKTTFVKHIVKEHFPRHIVFDTNFHVNEYDWRGFNRFTVEEHHSTDELKRLFDEFWGDLDQEEIGGKMHILKEGKVIDCLVIEECNMVAPARETPPFAFKFLTNIGRHINLTCFMLTRRPVQINTDAIELADWLVLFSLSGKNDREYFNSIKEDLGDAVMELDSDKHDFIMWRRGAKEWAHFYKIPIEPQRREM